MASLLVKNAEAIVTCGTDDAVVKNGNILMENGEITYIGTEEKVADKEVDATG